MSLPQVKLRDYYFERVSLKFPAFPSSGGVFILQKAKGRFTTYTNEKKKNLVAYRWVLTIDSLRKPRKSGDFGLFISIVGIFEVGDLINVPKNKISLVREYAPKALYDVIKMNFEKIFFHTLVKRLEFPVLDFKKLKNKKFVARGSRSPIKNK